ncbi:hypothetical protein MVEN_00266100 [Mycena venus]|uniref:Uncharacterized protein n=1 Tax=Mycena venus TaxID=2733690 RepID=A0A8H6YYI0_9AGAR|nr:hypothetical protein MVEN_00266100 [Mycena venus]
MDPQSSTLELPSELERHIFELCACSRPVTIPKLMLVAWRVKEWVEPLLYRTIIISPSEHPIEGYPIFTKRILAAVLHSKPATFFRDSVRYLLLHAVSDDFVQFTLSRCTGVQNLWAPNASVALIDASAARRLPLRHLYTNFTPLFHDDVPLAGQTQFAQLTHLELIGAPPEDTDVASTLSHLPRLTHLSFNEEEFIPSCLALLQKCRCLLALISLDGKSLRSTFHEYEVDLAKDPRFVVMYSSWFKDWQKGVHAGMDYWTRAEEFIEKRRSRMIDVTDYEVPDDDPRN